MHYRFASVEDIDMLTEQRVRFIYTMKSRQPDDEQSRQISESCRDYFEATMPCGESDTVLAFDDERLVAFGTIFYYRSLPSLYNPKGTNAYITSIFVEPEYRRRGIATHIVSMLVERARSNGVISVMLSASDEGSALYRKLGFEDTHNAMFLDTRKCGDKE